MSTAAPPRASGAWQPVTAGGVAAFAHSRWSRIFLVSGAVALVSMAAVMYLLLKVYVPALEGAFKNLPEMGYLDDGRLSWTGPSQSVLYQDSFVELVVNATDEELKDQTADLQVELRLITFRLTSLFGYLESNYHPSWVAEVNRVGLQAWWGAWRMPLLLGLALGILAALLFFWSVLATIYSIPVFLVALLSNRHTHFSGGWRLSLAALLPGALFLSLAIVLYASHYLNLVSMLIILPVHLVISWGYLLLALRKLPALESIPSTGSNPFRTRSVKRSNPFQGKT